MTNSPQKLNDPALEKQLQEFLGTLSKNCGSNLESVVLYGGVAKNDYTAGKSNVNLLFIFDKVDLDLLDSVSLLFMQAMSDFRLSPFILTSSEVQPSSDVFAVKLFDIQQHHLLLYGKDFLAPLKFEAAHLRFISEQELRNQLSRMKFFYLKNFSLPELLLDRVRKGFTSLVINANTLLFLQNGTYYATRGEIIEKLKTLPGADQTALANLAAIKNETSGLSPELIRNAYDQLMLQYKWLIKSYK